MVTHKKRDTVITAGIIGAIIAALGAVGGGYYQGLGDTQYKDRPILDWSFVMNDTSLKNELEQDQGGYFINLFIDNRGQSDGKIIFEVKGNNSKVTLNQNLPSQYDQSIHFTVRPHPVMTPLKIYVIPDTNATSISFEVLAQDVQDKPQFQEENPYIPLKISYHQVNGKYELVR